MNKLEEEDCQGGSDWKAVKFEDIAENVATRVNPSQTDLAIYVGLEHLDSESLKIKRWGKPEDVKGEKFQVQKGDVIFGRRRAYLRKVAVADFDCICSAHSMVLRARPETIIKELFPFFLQSKQFMDRALQISVGSLSPTINWKTLSKQVFLIPPKEKQPYMLEILSTADQCLENNERLANAAETLRKLVASELLRRGIGNKEFKDTEIGRIPKSWKVVKLEDVAEVRANKSINSAQKIAFIPMELIPQSEVFAQYRIKLKRDAKSFTYCEAGDLLLAKITPSLENGKQGIVPSDVPNGVALATTEVYPIKCTDIDTLFLFYVLKSSRFRNKIISSMIGTTGRLRAPRESVERLNIPLPPADEQQEMVKIFSKIDLMICNVRKHIEITKALKMRLINQLLTKGVSA
jgi:type I restriction enzyme S subunit